MKIFKHAVGIDVSKDSLSCCFGSIDDDQNEKFSIIRSFANSEAGFKALLKWISTLTKNEVWFVLEATGVYYENLAY